jgi:DNA-binding MarR family transcriptional regulator
MASTDPNLGLQHEIGKRKPFDCPQEEVFLNIVRASDHLLYGVSQFLHEHGLSMSLYNALRIVVGEGAAGIPVRTIADRMIVRQPDVTRLVDRLEQVGFVERIRSREDRRVVHVHATAAGRERAQALKIPLRQLHQAQLSALSADQLKHVNQLMVLARQGAAPSSD